MRYVGTDSCAMMVPFRRYYHTVRVDMVISAPDVPASYQEKCNALKFITKVAYGEAKKGIDERQKQWNEEMKKKLGLTEE